MCFSVTGDAQKNMTSPVVTLELMNDLAFSFVYGFKQKSGCHLFSGFVSVKTGDGNEKKIMNDREKVICDISVRK